jgi:hypothetical protein
METGIVQPELLQCVAQVLVLVRVGGVYPGKDHGLDLPISGEELGGAVRGIQDGVAHSGVPHISETGDQVSHFAGRELAGGMLA